MFMFLVVVVVVVVASTVELVKDNVGGFFGPRQRRRGHHVKGNPLERRCGSHGLGFAGGVQRNVVPAALDLPPLVPIGLAVADQVQPDRRSRDWFREHLAQEHDIAS